jgi:hypothetical protein
MGYRQCFLFVLLCLVMSCSSVPKAVEDNFVLTKQTKSTRMGEWANFFADDFALWDVESVAEYGFIPNDYFVYDTSKYQHSKAIRTSGVRTMTSNSYVVPKEVLGELVGKMEYWLAREVRNTFYEKVHVSNVLYPIFQPNPKKAEKVFYFKNTPANDIDRFKAALSQSGIDQEDIPKIIKECSRILGWRSLTHFDPNRPKDYPSWAETRTRQIMENEFHTRCFGNIVKYSNYIRKYLLVSEKALPPMFENSKYIRGWRGPKIKAFTQYKDSLITEVIDYDVLNRGWYEAGFLEHLKGKYGNDIRENLKHNLYKGGFYKQDNLRVMVILSDATQLLSELNFVDDEYYFTQQSQMNWTSHILNKVFDKDNAKGLYRDYYSRVDAMQGKTQYSNTALRRGVLQSLKAKCNFDLGKVQLAYKAASRFEFNCLHKPIKTGNDKIDKQDYQSYKLATTSEDAPNNVLSSHVTLTSLQDSSEVKGTITPLALTW